MKEKKKKEKKEKVDKQLEKLEKTDFKVKRPVGKTIVAVILWIVVGFFFVKGLTVSFLAEDSTTVKEALSEHMDSLTQALLHRTSPMIITPMTAIMLLNGTAGLSIMFLITHYSADRPVQISRQSFHQSLKALIS